MVSRSGGASPRLDGRDAHVRQPPATSQAASPRMCVHARTSVCVCSVCVGRCISRSECVEGAHPFTTRVSDAHVFPTESMYPLLRTRSSAGSVGGTVHRWVRLFPA